ncbi:MAG TPA: response regulator [Candidatus Eisenbacteria bacterium]|nr:response regulator [Candidatus Eisenbacteria bacterium]
MGPVAVLNHSVAISTSAVRVLLLERNSEEAERILAPLRSAGFELEPIVAANFEELESAVRTGSVHAAILNGRTAKLDLRRASQLLSTAWPIVPFVVLTDSPEEEASAECLRWGASDYVPKASAARLAFALRRALVEGKLAAEAERMRSALRESERRGRDLMENAVYGIFEASAQGTFRAANETLLKIMACSSFPELQPLNLVKDVFRYPEAFAQLLTECQEKGSVQNAESEWRRRDGGIVSVRLHLCVRPEAASGNTIEGIVEDVTEMRALERQLQQAQKFETIGQLAGGIAHDFNNVLGAVLGWAEIGYDQCKENPHIAEYFAHIRQQTDRAAALTRELLTFARRQPLKPRPVQLNGIVEGLMSLLDKVIGKDIEIRTQLGDLQPVKAEPAQLEQVLMNICLNARDAMPDGGRLRIKTEMMLLDDSFCHFYPGVTSGTYVVLSISDTGCGMSPEVRDRIFEPFYTTKERGKGSGMGLATVYGIVRQHGGFLHVYSELGQGTLFHVYLPALDKSATEEFKESGGAATAKSLQGSETILLAEDHDSIRELVRQSLTRLGYRVLAAADGKQALHLADLEFPALAVLDVVMPHMGGAATAAELLRRNEKIPILFTSGFSEKADQTAARIPGSHYLQKPYSPTSLASTIREILDT